METADETAWIDSLRAATAQLAAGDPRCTRFGAAQHRYVARPPLGDAGTRALEARIDAELPRDLEAFARRFASGGVGPAYGLLPLERAPVIEAPPHAPFSRALVLAHAGCGYTLVVGLDGPGAGQIALDARDLGEFFGVAASFAELYARWIACALRGEWMPGGVAAGKCALPVALSSYFSAVEARLGLAADTLAGAQLREALDELGPGAIELGAIELGADRSTVFAPGERMDPCQTCAQLIETLAAAGLRRDVIAPGVLPRPAREP